MIYISDSIMDIISGLSQDDISSLKEMADSLLKENPSLGSLLGGSEEKKSEKKSGGDGQLPLSPEMIMKLGNIMSSFSGTDERIALLLAIKPLLSPRRQQRTDNAIQLLKLLRILPTVGKLGLF